MPRAVLDHLWTHESSRYPGASYTAPGPGKPQDFFCETNIFRETIILLTTICILAYLHLLLSFHFWNLSLEPVAR